MAIRFMDGFDTYHGTNNTDISVALTRNYTVVNDEYLKCSTGRYTGMGLTMSYDKNRTYIEKTGLSATGVARFIVGFNIKATTLAGLGYGAFTICPSNATSFYYGLARKGLTFCVNGEVYYNTGDNAPWNGGVQLTANTWSHWELVLPVSPGAGNPTIIYKDGIQVYSSTNIDSNFAWNGSLRIGSVPFSQADPQYYVIDDLYVLDDTGSTNNARLSSSTYVPRIETLVPTSTVANDYTLTGVAAAHEALDNIPLNTGHYIASTTTGHKARFNVGDLTNITNVKGVQFTGVCSNSTAANNDWKFLMSNTEVGTTKTVTDILANSTPITQQIFETNPITASAWTVSDVNSIETGIINK
jgi:hypothetical protein